MTGERDVIGEVDVLLVVVVVILEVIIADILSMLLGKDGAN